MNIRAFLHKLLRISGYFLIMYLFYGFFYKSTNRRRSDVKDLLKAHYLKYKYELKSQDDESHKGCEVPYFEPRIVDRDAYILELIESENCGEPKDPIIERNETHLWIAHDIKQFKEFYCCYETAPLELNVYLLMSKNVDPKSCKQNFTSFLKVLPLDKFVKVCCFIKSTNVFENVYLFSSYEKKSRNKLKSVKISTPYNIVVLGVDGVSYTDAIMKMPLTITTINKFGGIELFTYSNVGDYASTSLTPIITGLTQMEAVENCLSFGHLRTPTKDCSLIWMKYKEADFFTAMAESSTYRYYDYSNRLFEIPKTDYHFHLFDQETPKENKSYLECLWEKTFYEVFLDNIQNLFSAFHSSRMFGFFWEATINKNFLKIDETFEKFFRNIKESGFLDKTIFFFVGNLAKRDGNPLNSRFEARVPFAYVMLPPTFRPRYRKAYKYLRQNRLRLTTPLDLHKTLEFLTDMNNFEDDKIDTLIRHELSPFSSAINLFWPIPSKRNCRTAMIDKYFCPCLVTESVKKPSTVHKMAKQIVDSINMLVKDLTGCVRVFVSTVLNMTEYISPFAPERREFELHGVHVMPGHGTYKGRVLSENGGRSWKVIDVERTNPYEMSKCSEESPHLAPFCYCVL